MWAGTSELPTINIQERRPIVGYAGHMHTPKKQAFVARFPRGHISFPETGRAISRLRERR